MRYNESDGESRKKRNRKRKGCSKAKANNYHPSTDVGDPRPTLFSCVHTGLIRHCSSSSDEEQCEKSAGLILYIYQEAKDRRITQLNSTVPTPVSVEIADITADARACPLTPSLVHSS